MTFPRALRAFAALPLLGPLLLLTACPGKHGPQDPEFSFKVDAKVKPLQATLPGKGGVPRPVGALSDENGVTSAFIQNEILFRPAKPGTPEGAQELEKFLARLGGTVVKTDALPAKVRGMQIPKKFQSPTEYTVRVDASAFTLENFKADVEDGLERGGSATFSSEGAARLLALVAHETVSGHSVSPNFVMWPDAFLGNPQDHSIPTGGFVNVFSYYPHNYDLDGPKTGMTAAWAYLAMRNVTHRVRVAVIDGGFHLDGAGMPLTTGAGGVSDYAIPAGETVPLQWDAQDDDDFAGGQNGVSCGDGPCYWHGHEAALTAAGIFNNQFGYTGSGGQIADPILLKADTTTGAVKEALHMAESMGAQVVSMSFSGECDNVFCQFYYTAERYADAFWDARRSGMILFSSAGNRSFDARNTIPCRYNGAVTCIGALNRDDNLAADYSSYGDNVDLFAPAGQPVWGPNNDGVIDTQSYYGTSAATPYTAGVAAMLKASNPALTPAEIENFLLTTAHTDSPDPKVRKYLSAINAIRAVFGNEFPTDSFEPNNSTAAPRLLGIGSVQLSLDLGQVAFQTASDQDHYLIRISNWRGLRIFLDRSEALTRFDVTLSRVGGGIGPRRTAATADDLHIAQAFTGLAPGDYLLTIRHGSGRGHYESLYNLLLEIPFETAPTGDVYEANNTLGTAYNFGSRRGTFAATLHTASDLDHYRFDVGGFTGSETMDFVVRGSDAPLTLEVFDTAFNPVSITTSNSVTLGTGTWLVRVKQASGLISRYSVTTLGAVPIPGLGGGQFTPRAKNFWKIIAELGNMDLSVIRGAEYLLIPKIRPNEYFFAGNVDAQLLDSNGKLLGRGTAQDNGQGLLITRLSLKGAPADQELLIRVAPLGWDAAIVDEAGFENASFAEEPFTMNWPTK